MAAVDAGPPAPAATCPRRSRVGVGLGAVILGSLLFERHLFVAVLALSTAVGTWELAGALRRGAGIAVPLPVLLVGGQAMIWLAWPFGAARAGRRVRRHGAGLLLWRMRAGRRDYVRDVGAAVFTAAYVPLFCSFATMLVVPADGAGRVLTFLICVVASDVGGYAAGVLAGRHPMAPTISPKKSWEGFAGSHRRRHGRRARACRRAAARRRLVVGVLIGSLLVGQRHARRPGRVADQARPGHQGHGLAAARPRRPDGPAGLAAADRGRGLGCSASLVPV